MKNILVAYDGGEPARRALETAIELARQFDGSLGIVSVIPVHAGRTPIDPWDDKTVHDRQLDDARRLAASHADECRARIAGARRAHRPSAR